MMLSSKRVNKGVVDMYKNKQPYIETTITIRTPLDKESELYKKFSVFMGNIEPTLEGLNNDVENVMGETFESDVVSVYSTVKNL